MHNQAAKQYHRLPLLLLTASILILCVTLTLSNVIFSSEFDRKVKKLSDEGYPVSLDDLEKTYVLPGGAENAADIYLEAFNAYVEPTDEELESLPYGKYQWHKDSTKPLPLKVIAAIESSIQKNIETLRLLDKASKIENCVYPITRTQENLRSSIDYFSISSPAKLISNRNMFLAHTQQSNSAFESIQTLIALSNSFCKQKSQMEFLLAISLQRCTANSLEDTLGLAKYSDKQLSTLYSQFRNMRQLDLLTPIIISDLVMGIEIYKRPTSEQGDLFFESIPLLYLYSYSGIKKMDAINHLDYLESVIQTALLPPADRFDRIEEIASNSDGYFANNFLSSFEERYEYVMYHTTRITGNLLCAETALAIERFRLKHKTLPDSLDQLVPEFLDETPIISFNDNPISYRQLEDAGYALYPLGDEQKENKRLKKNRLPDSWYIVRQ